MSKRKPPPAKIAAAPPLSKLAVRPADPFLACNVCGGDSDRLKLMREHDEHDEPIVGDGALVFVGEDHEACMKAVDDHPRLYAELRGNPGTFPTLCGPCTLRSGFRCTHPDLKANGGAGLLVKISGFAANAIICGTGGCWRPLATATSCAGRIVPPPGPADDPTW